MRRPVVTFGILAASAALITAAVVGTFSAIDRRSFKAGNPDAARAAVQTQILRLYGLRPDQYVIASVVSNGLLYEIEVRYVDQANRLTWFQIHKRSGEVVSQL